MVESDASETDPRVVLTPGVGDDDDGVARAQHVARVFGEPTVEPDVDRPAEMPGREQLRGSPVDHDRSIGLAAEHVVDVEAWCVLRVVEELAFGAVRVGREREVQRSDGLSLRDGLDELVLGHRRQRVVGAPLLSDRRFDGGRQVLATRRAGAVGRVHAGRVRETEKLVVERPEELPGQVIRAPSDRGEQVRPADVADEQGVAGENAPRRRVVRVLPDHDRDRFGGVTRRVTDLEDDVAEGEALPVDESVDGEIGPGFVAIGDDRAGCRGELEVTGEEVGMEVRLDHPLDAHTEAGGVREVLRDITLGVDDDRASGGLVTDQVAEQ